MYKYPNTITTPAQGREFLVKSSPSFHQVPMVSATHSFFTFLDGLIAQAGLDLMATLPHPPKSCEFTAGVHKHIYGAVCTFAYWLLGKESFSSTTESATDGIFQASFQWSFQVFTPTPLVSSFPFCWTGWHHTAAKQGCMRANPLPLHPFLLFEAPLQSAPRTSADCTGVFNPGAQCPNSEMSPSFSHQHSVPPTVTSLL